jgi:dipeptidyl aminopeptidase/acylaminoacyl peptidase
MTDRENELDAPAAVVGDNDAGAVLFPGAPDEPASSVSAEGDESLPLVQPPMPGDANVSPDGTRIAFLQRDVAGVLALWLCPLDGGEPKQIETGIDLLDDGDAPQWSPDGAWLAVTGAHPADGRSAIFLVGVEATITRLLVDHPGVDRLPRWSPDGNAVAFVSRRFGQETINLTPVDSGGPAVQLTQGASGQDDHAFCWSTDGNRIAFLRRTVEGDQVGDHVWTITLDSGATKQITKKLAPRRTPTWNPVRQLVMHIMDDTEWRNVAVVDVDTTSAWNIASEAGDKADPCYSADGQRVVYTRYQNGFVRVCERAASSATAEAIDRGSGTARSPRFLPDKRVLYLSCPATGAPRFVVQEAKADAERFELPPVVAWSTERNLITPRHIEVETAERRVPGLFYRMDEVSGPTPAVLYLAERPDRRRAAEFDAVAQALAASGLALFAPSLRGTPGYGRKITGALKDQAAGEAEALELLAIHEALSKIEGVDWGRVAVVGSGHGGALALLFAGSRPGRVQAVAAIDPVADWDIEVDAADAEYRDWLTKTFGIRAGNRGVYALRTPSTFAGVIDVPVLIVGTDRAPAGRAQQLDELTADMRDLDVEFEHDVSHGESDWEVGLKVAQFLRRVLSAVESPVDARTEQVLDAAAV